jgi:CrcB protein
MTAAFQGLQSANQRRTAATLDASDASSTLARVQQLALVCLGGALGSGLRYLVTIAAVRWLGADFPWGTFFVNVVGAFVIGFVQHLAAGQMLSEDNRLLLSTGVLGGLTTYSAFSYETVHLAELGAWRAATMNVVATTVLCIVLCYAGILLGRLVTR